MTEAAQRIAAERARDPRVVQLAEAASLAARVESELLRALRLHCVPGADASVEADLWFCPLVGVRSSGVLALDGDVATELRRHVALDLRGPMETAGARERVAGIAEVIARIHAGAPPLLRLEEAVIAGLVLGRDPAELDEKLRSVLGAMAHQPSRQRALASWAWAALPRLPLDHVALPSAGALCVATGLAMKEAMSMPMRVGEGALAGVPSQLVSVTGSVELSVRRAGPWLVLAHAGGGVPPQRKISVPATTPRYVEVVTGAGDATLVALAPQGAERVKVEGAAEVRLRSLDGKEWKVVRTRRTGPAPAAPVFEVTVLYFHELAQLDDPSMAAEIERDLGSLLAEGEKPALVLVSGASGRDLTRDRPVLPRFCDEAFVLLVPGQNDARFESPEKTTRRLSDVIVAETMFDAYSRAVWRQAFGHLFDILHGPGTGLRSFELSEGPRPGCFTATLASGEGRIGICGLNNWYLDPALLGESIPDVDARLLPAEIDRWCERHDLTILLLSAAPERFRPHRRLHFEHAVARPGRFDLVLGAAEGMVFHAGTVDRLDYAMLPGPRYTVLRLRDEGSQTTVQIWPRLRGSDRFDVDHEMTSSEHLDVKLPSRRQPPLPRSPASVTECLDLLRDGRSIALWGPGDSDVEGIAQRVRAHLAHAGWSPIIVATEEELATARAARVPQPVYCTTAVELRPSSGSDTSPTELFFYQLAATQAPERLAGVADIVMNNDLTLDEALECFPGTERETMTAIHQRAAGAAGVVTRLLGGANEEDLSKWLREVLVSNDIGILTAYREILDGHPPPASRIAAISEQRRLQPGLFRRDGSERNPWYRELLGHRWIDAQLERDQRLPEPRLILVLGTSVIAAEVVRALGKRGWDYGIVVRGYGREPQIALIRIFLGALPEEVPRSSRVQVIFDSSTRTVTDPIMRSVSMVFVDAVEPQQLVERAHAVIDASTSSDDLDISHALGVRAELDNIPVLRPNLRVPPGEVAVRALKFLDIELIKKHIILFLGANPIETDRIALDREARAIHVELARSGFQNRFEFVTRWAVEPLDLLRELRKLQPTVVHFSGHGHSEGLVFQGPDDRIQVVSIQALKDTFGTAGASVKVVVLSACYTDAIAEALVVYVDCVVGMVSAVLDAAAREFAIGFYGGLGEGESVAAAYRQGCAAISLAGLDRDDPREMARLKIRAGVDPAKLVLVAETR